MGVAPYCHIWGIWARIGKLTMTRKQVPDPDFTRPHFYNQELVGCRIMRKL